MPLALITSSFVAASRVGGGGQQHAFAALQIDPVLVPTVLFGRHPGKGPPGGAAVAPDVFESALAAALDDVARKYADAIVAGYFASAEQVRTAAAAVDDLRSAADRGAISGRLAVVVDPIMGDEDTGLYVRPEVAAALVEVLAPRADWLTPNLWELERITGERARTAQEAARVARRLGTGALVTSVPGDPGEIGVVLVPADGPAVFFGHARYDTVLRGTGDLITAVFAAGLIHGREPHEAARRAAAAAAETVKAAVEWGAPELPLIALGPRLAAPTAPVRVQVLD